MHRIAGRAPIDRFGVCFHNLHGSTRALVARIREGGESQSLTFEFDSHGGSDQR
jgi:hypothetical protein